MPLFPRFRQPKSRKVVVFDGQDYRKAMIAASSWLEQHRDSINKLNVFPVPDGDTGTNMAATMRAATKAVTDINDTNVGVIAQAFSEGAIRGARGNSGVILSQILRGISNSLQNKATFTAKDLAAALQIAAQNAYRAVVKPVEGTILTVIRECAEAARNAADRGSDITTLMQEVVACARQTVAHTPELLPTLKQAGVVDAGGQGLTMVFEGFLRYTRGESVQILPEKSKLDEEVAEIHRGLVSVDEEFGYEVVFLLRGEHLDQEGIRNTLVAMGGVSTVVAGDETMLKVHTHSLAPGKILDYGVSLGSLEDINIENLQAQSLRYAAESAREHGIADTSTAKAGAIAHADTTRTPSRILSASNQPAGELGIVAVVSGEGFEKVFESLGANGIVFGGQTMNPSTEEILHIVNSVQSPHIVILPNNSNIIMSAQQVQALTGKIIHVIPTKSMPQGIASLMACKFDSDVPGNIADMTEAIQHVTTGEITVAVRDAVFNGISVRNGEYIGLVNDVLVTSGQDLIAVLHTTLERMETAQREVVTFYFGGDITIEKAQEAEKQVAEWYPEQSIELVDGGQPHYLYVISAE